MKVTNADHTAIGYQAKCRMNHKNDFKIEC